MTDIPAHCVVQVAEQTGGEAVKSFKRGKRRYVQIEVRGSSNEEGCAQVMTFEIALAQDCAVTYIDETAHELSCPGVH